MNSLTRRLLVLGVLLAPVLVLVAQAQIMFTVTGTATSTGSGYFSGQSYTFVFTTGQTFAATPTSYYYANRTLWSEETTGDGQLWAAISGTGITGTLVRPMAVNTDPYSMLRVYKFDSGSPYELMTRVDADTTTDIGLKTPGGQSVSHVNASLAGGTLPTFAFNLSYTQPTDYFSAYLGNYVPGSTYNMEVGLTGGGVVGFTATGVSIAAVPEPAACAVWAGLIMLILGGGHRLRRTARRSVPTGAAAP